MSRPTKRILLLHMPMASPVVANLAIEILASTLRAAGMGADTFYGTLRFPRTPRMEAFIHSAAGEAIFTPLLFPGQTSSRMLEQLLDCDRGTGELMGNLKRLFGGSGPSREQLAAEVTSHMACARLCLDRCLEEIPPGRYAAYGFSVGFDAQRVSSLALASHLKEREPDCRIIFGGTAVDGVMGQELLKSFPFVDVVSQGDADWRIAAMVEALFAGWNVDHIPGVLSRCNNRIMSTGDASPGENLDEIVPPDYDSFVDQLAGSDWSDQTPILLFEASRGCWWGEKHHCRFCGLRADGLHFRRKSGFRAAGEIDSLARRYPQHRVLYSTDSILDFRASRDLLPRLASLRKTNQWKLFFEIKSNISRADVALLADAGVTAVQPGIENFSDRVLSLMDKGSTARKNVELLRSLASYQIKPIYNILVGTPGERAGDYAETLELLPRLHHLPPPAQVCRLQLDRFSPYFRAPDSFGMTSVQPEAVYRIIYPDHSIDLRNLVYCFQYELVQQFDEQMRAVWARLERLVQEWRDSYQSHSLGWRDAGEQIIIREENGSVEKRDILSGTSARLFRLCEQGGTLSHFAKSMPEVSRAVLSACLERWRQRGWLFRFASGLYLNLVPEIDPKPSAARDNDHQVTAAVHTHNLVPLAQLNVD